MTWVGRGRQPRPTPLSVQSLTQSWA